jgi:polysaccharide biosynthesis/export protein
MFLVRKFKSKWIIAVASVFVLTALGFSQDSAAQASSAQESVAKTSPAPAAGSASAPANTAVSDSTATTTSGTPQFQTRTNRYRLSAGDSFDLNFDLSPEFNQTGVTVQPDGYVTLRGVGDLKVEGQNVPELTNTLHAAYAKILHDPIISVVLKDFEKPYFVADGQLGKPGKYDLRGNVTLTEAIAIAGGFTEKSKHSQVLLFRRVDDKWMEAKIINVKKMEKAGNLAEDPFLHPGDMLFVPKNTLSKIDRLIPTASMGTFFPLP